MNQEQIYTYLYNVAKAHYTRCRYCRCKAVEYQLRNEQAVLRRFYSNLFFIAALILIPMLFVRVFITGYYKYDLYTGLTHSIIANALLILSVICSRSQRKFESVSRFGMVCKKCGKFSCIKEYPRELDITLEQCMGSVYEFSDSDFYYPNV